MRARRWLIPDANSSREHFDRGVALFNRGQFFEAHEELEEAMNLLEGDGSDWEFYLGRLRAAAANHKRADGVIDSAIADPITQKNSRSVTTSSGFMRSLTTTGNPFTLVKLTKNYELVLVGI